MARERASMREVADRAGVAMSSVSRVLSDHPDVSPNMRDRVMAAVDELGYQPDFLAQSLRRRETMTVGFIVGDISNPLLAEITLGAETTLRDAGYSMVLANSMNEPELDAQHVRMFTRRRVDGLIASLAAEDDAATLHVLADIDVPIVLIDRELPSDVPNLEPSAVLSDHRAGMRAAVAHLLELGHRRLGLISGPRLRFSRERELGVRDAYAAHGLKPTFRTIEGPMDAAHGGRATRELLDDPHPVTAIVAGGNQFLPGTLAELKRQSVKVGADISLVSCDDIALTELFEPPIAVIRRDTRELGRRAAQLLLRQFGGDTKSREVLLPTEFVARESCAPPPS